MIVNSLLGYLIFPITLGTLKSIDNTMKKMLLATALALLITDVLNGRLLFKTNRQQ